MIRVNHPGPSRIARICGKRRSISCSEDDDSDPEWDVPQKLMKLSNDESDDRIEFYAEEGNVIDYSKDNCSEQEGALDEEEQAGEFSIGMLVIVEYEGELFPGRIEDILRDSVTVSCMKKCLSQGSTWMWPSRIDLHDYPNDDVKFKNITLNELPGTSRRQEYHIAELDDIWGGQEYS